MNEALRIEVVSTEERAYNVVNSLIFGKHGNNQVFGLDCEWDAEREKGTKGLIKPDILQIGLPDGYCAIFRLHLMKTMPPRLKEFLEDPQYLKVGVAVAEDTLKLNFNFGIVTRGVLDVRFLADEEGFDPRGLSHLSETVLGIPCRKYHYAAFHSWTGVLTQKLKKYAAMDAIYGVQIFSKLNHDHFRKLWGTQCTTWGHKEYHKKMVGLWGKYFDKLFEYTRSRYFIGKVVETMMQLSDTNTNILLENNGFT